MNAVEAGLAAAFELEAASTPLPNPAWRGPAYPVRTPSSSMSRRRRTAVFALAGVATFAALVAVALSRSDHSSTSTTQAPWELGEEFSTAVSATTTEISPLAKPGSVTFIDVPGEPTPRASFETASYEPTGVIRARCVTLRASGACGDPAWGGDWQQDDSFVAWAIAPPGTMYASYDDGSTRQWQRVIGAYPIFRRGEGPTPVITAYDVAGNVLGQNSLAISHERALEPLDYAARLASVPGEWRNAAADEFRTTLGECIVNVGASFAVPNVPALPPGKDNNATWDQCIDEAKRAADQRFVELGGLLPIP